VLEELRLLEEEEEVRVESSDEEEVEGISMGLVVRELD